MENGVGRSRELQLPVYSIIIICTAPVESVSLLTNITKHKLKLLTSIPPFKMIT